jgi:hypothetical protein
MYAGNMKRQMRGAGLLFACISLFVIIYIDSPLSYCSVSTMVNARTQSIIEKYRLRRIWTSYFGVWGSGQILCKDNIVV